MADSRSIPVSTDFEVAELPPMALRSAWGFSFVLPLLFTVAALALSMQRHTPKRLIADDPLLTMISTIALVVVLTLPLAIWLHRILLRASVKLEEGMIDIRAGAFHQRVAVSAIDFANARVVDLREHGEWWPSVSDGGVSMPGLRLGNFRLIKQKRRAFCLLRDRSFALLLPERTGRVLLLGLKRPNEVLRKLQG